MRTITDLKSVKLGNNRPIVCDTNSVRATYKRYIHTINTLETWRNSYIKKHNWSEHV